MNPYQWFIQVKNFLYRQGYISTFKPDIPVISVGNINTGGSGKTPFIQYLVKNIQSRHPDKKMVIISRSYKASLRYASEVTAHDVTRVEVYGDEACLLKSVTGVDVWSGPNKTETLKQALSSKKYDIALIDDGFSHLKTARQLDLVLFDVSRDEKHYRLIPAGFMREPWSALKRASLVILTKKEKQPPEKINQFKRKISQFQKNILDSDFIMDFSALTATTEKNIYLFAGIGNPEALAEAFRQKGYNLIQVHSYPDHYSFPFSEQEKIWNEICRLKEQKMQGQTQRETPGEILSHFEVVTTAKDYIKLTHDELKEVVKVVDLQVEMADHSRKVLDEKISQLF